MSDETPTTETAEKTFTQADVDHIVGTRIAQERERFADYESLKEQASKVSDLETRLNESNSAREAAELTALRSSVALDKNVPLTMLTATDKEALEAQAQALLDWRGEATPSPTQEPAKREANSSGNSTPGTAPDPKARAAQALRDLSI